MSIREANDHYDAMARELAETWINGNRSDAIERISRIHTKLRVATVAIGVFEKLRGAQVGGIHDANAFRAALERRINT